MAGLKAKKTKAKELSEKIVDNSLLINSALDLGHTTKSAISEVTGLKLYEINNTLQADKKLFQKFRVVRATLADKAADNLTKIIDDPNHPSHFAATKYVLQTYKSDLDDSMEAKKSDSLEIGIGKVGKDPVKIRFGK